jgi:hypothetical protein
MYLHVVLWCLHDQTRGLLLHIKPLVLIMVVGWEVRRNQTCVISENNINAWPFDENLFYFMWWDLQKKCIILFKLWIMKYFESWQLFLVSFYSFHCLGAKCGYHNSWIIDVWKGEQMTFIAKHATIIILNLLLQNKNKNQHAYNQIW